MPILPEVTEMVERLNLSSEWKNALDKLQGVEQAGLGWRYTGEHDVTPLALMLAAGVPVPSYVARTIATHINPPKDRWTGRLKYEPPPLRAINFWKSQRKKQDIQDFYYQEMKQNGSLSAIKDAAKRFNVSEGAVQVLIGRDLEKEAFNEAARRLDPGTSKP